jgi:SAM-dependent methyltransferase
MINPEEIANIAEQEEMFWWFRGMRKIAFQLLDPIARQHKIERIFEGGCGTGHFASLVRERYGAAVFGADLDSSAARICGGRAGVECVRGNLASVPFPTSTFDLVLAMDVLAHFPEGDEGRAFRELLRILRPGGFLLLRTSALGIFRSRHSEFVWERQRFSKRRLRQLALREGFAVEQLFYANFLLSPLALLKFRIWEPLTQPVPASGLTPLGQPVETFFYGALRIEGALIRCGFRAPFGQSLYLLARKQ